MYHDRLEKMKDTLVCAVESQLYNLAEADTEELSEAIDMIKDLEEAIYYCTVTKAMEEHTEDPGYYTTPRMMNGERMYYRDRHSNNEGNRTDGRDKSYYSQSSSNGSSGGNGNSSQYSEKEYPYEFRDYREGRSPRSRRMYMEAKETHQGKDSQMKELEKYMQELTQDVVEMVEDASPEEKQYLSKRIAVLANKLSQLNG